MLQSISQTIALNGAHGRHSMPKVSPVFADIHYGRPQRLAARSYGFSQFRQSQILEAVFQGLTIRVMGGLLLFGISSALGYWLAKRKNRNAVVWALASLFLPIIAPLVLWLFVRRRWRTLSEYLSLYPNCRTGQGFSCAFCGSKSIRAVGVRGPTDGNKLHTCNHCGSGLYET